MLLAKIAFKDFSPAGVNIFAVTRIFAADVWIKTTECKRVTVVCGINSEMIFSCGFICRRGQNCEGIRDDSMMFAL